MSKEKKVTFASQISKELLLDRDESVVPVERSGNDRGKEASNIDRSFYDEKKVQIDELIARCSPTSHSLPLSNASSGP